MIIEKALDDISYQAACSIDGIKFMGRGLTHTEAMEDCFARMFNADNPALM